MLPCGHPLCHGCTLRLLERSRVRALPRRATVLLPAGHNCVILGFSACFACVTIPTTNHIRNKFLCFFPSLHSCVHYISKNSYELLREPAGTRTFLPGIQSLKDEKTNQKRQCRFVRGHLGQVFKELVRMDRRRSAATAPRADRFSTGRRCRTWMVAPLFLRPEMAATDRTMLQMRRRPSP